MKKPTKRKMYQKRRKKEKAEQRRKVSETTTLPEATATSHYKNNKQYQRNIPNYPTSYNKPNPITSYSQGIQLWWQTYCSAIEFHHKQQNAWRDEMKHRQMKLLEKYANEYDTSSDEEDNNDECEYFNGHPNESKEGEHINKNFVMEDVDEEYLKFLEITHKHREELRLKRTQENI